MMPNASKSVQPGTDVGVYTLGCSQTYFGIDAICCLQVDDRRHRHGEKGRENERASRR